MVLWIKQSADRSVACVIKRCVRTGVMRDYFSIGGGMNGHDTHLLNNKDTYGGKSHYSFTLTIMTKYV